MFRRTRQSNLPAVSDPTSAAIEIAEPLAFGQRVYRSFPAPIMSLLLRRKGVGRPTAVVESVEGSTSIPCFETHEFDALMLDMADVAADATAKLKTLTETGSEVGGAVEPVDASESSVESSSG
jgi:hypothetical protein